MLFILFLGFALRLYGAISIPPLEDNILHDFPSARKISFNPSNFNFPLVETLPESSGMAWKYLIRTGWYVFGDSLLAARLPFMMIGIVTILLVYFFVKTGLGTTAALFSVFLLSISPYYIGVTRIVDDVSICYFFTALSLFLLYKAVVKSRKKLFLLNGVVIGIAFWFKEMTFFLIPITVIFLMVCGEYRFWLKDKYVWLSFGVAFTIMLPLIILNLDSAIPRFGHINGEADFGLSINAIGFYLGELILLTLKPFPDLFYKIAITMDSDRPLVNFILGILILIAVIKSLKDRRAFVKLLVVCFLFNFVLFSVISHTDKTHCYWTLESLDWSAMSFIPGVILAGNMFIVHIKKNRSRGIVFLSILVIFMFIRALGLTAYRLNYFFPTKAFQIEQLLFHRNNWLFNSPLINEGNKGEVQDLTKDILKRIHETYDNRPSYKRTAALKLAQILIQEGNDEEAKIYIYSMLSQNPDDNKALSLLEELNRDLIK